MENKDDEVEKILNELKFAGGNEPQPKNDENADSASFKLNEKEMLSPQKAKTEKTAEPENPQPKENGGEKENGLEAIEKDLIKARENDNEVQKPSLPFAPEEINPQNGNYTDEYPEAEGTASASSLAFFGNYTDEYPEAEGYMINSKNI